MKYGRLIGMVPALAFATAVNAGDVLHVKKVAAAPEVDGVAEGVWDSAPVLKVKVAPIPQALIDMNKQKQTGKYASKWEKTGHTAARDVELRAVYTGDRVFFLARWADDTKDDQHKPWKWQGDKETGEYVEGKEREDRLAIQFPIKGSFSNNMLVSAESVRDVWHWKAARTDGVGLMHDKSHLISTVRPPGTSAQHFDAQGNELYVSRPGDGGVSPYKSNKIDPFVHQGDMVANYVPTRPDAEDAADVAGKGAWKDGHWVVEAGRKLDTGHHATDAVFDPAKGTEMSIAVFDHAGDHFHAVSDVIKVVFE